MARILAAVWGERAGLRHLDETGPVHTGVTIRGIPDLVTTVVALIHPSLRHASLRHRRYDGLVGAAAEVRMIADALASAPAGGSLTTEG